MLSHVAEENQRRDSELRPSCVRLQCLRCRSEFTREAQSGEEEAAAAAGRARRRGAAMLPEAAEERGDEEPTEGDDDGKGHFQIRAFIVVHALMLKKHIL